MSVIGIDFGNESSYVAVAKAGGIETIANDYSLRATPSCIAFCEKNRILGVAAKNQQVTNMKNTVYDLKRLLGRQFFDPHVQRELQYLPFRVVEGEQGKPLVQVNYLNAEQFFTPEQCIAMLFTKLKETASTALQTPINDCVISVPSYFTDNERCALLDAASIANLNVLRLLNETTATALAYGIYKQDLPPIEEKSRNVVFVDCGHSALQVFICAFNKDKLRMISTASDPNLGGRDFDRVLAEYFGQEFQQKYQMDVHSAPRAFLRLLAEVEKIKKQMSVNSSTLPLNIECLMEDTDVTSTMKRTDFEQLCAPLFQRATSTMKQCLQNSGLTLDEIYAVEIVGGSSRIPAIKQSIEKVFGKVPSTTLNQDEAVSRGCALQCAILSPAIRVRDFNIKDVQPYAVSVGWEPNGELEAFPVNHTVPFSKMFTFYRQEAFTLRAFYTGQIPYPDPVIGTWLIKNVTTAPDGQAQKVKVKVRINLHGVMTIANAALFETKEVEMETEPPEPEISNEQQPQQNGAADDADKDTPMTDVTGTAASTGGATNNTTTEDSNNKKSKQIVKSIDLPIEHLVKNPINLNQFVEQECKMIAADRQEKERADARNSLEEYVYDLRAKLSDDGECAAYVSDPERIALIQELDTIENWLYDEEGGESCNRAVYADKLSGIRTKGDQIQQRRYEHIEHPIVIEEFAKSLQQCLKAINEILNGAPKYSHLTDEDLNTLKENCQKSGRWLDDVRMKCQKTLKHYNPPITVAQIQTEKMNFETAIRAILNKPVPKPPTPPAEENNSKEPATTAPPTTGGEEQQQQEKKENCSTATANDEEPNNKTMDWSTN